MKTCELMGMQVKLTHLTLMLITLLLLSSVPSNGTDTSLKIDNNLSISQVQGSFVVNSLVIMTEVNVPHVSTWYYLNITNTYDQQQEFVFTFQVPENAFLSNVSLTVGNITSHGRVYPIDQARETYENETAANRTVGLVSSNITEKENKLQFTFNVLGNQTVLIGVQVEKALTRILGEYVLEISWDQFSSLSPRRVELNMTLFSPIPFVRIKSLTHDDLNSKFPSVTFAQASVHHMTDASALESPLRVAFSLTESYPRGVAFVTTNGTHDYFMFNLAPWVGAYDRFYKKFIFVLDTSGSMGEENKITQAKEALVEILGLLEPQDYFTLVEFDTAVNVYSTKMLPANTSNIQQAISHVEAISSGGRTNFNDGLITALNLTIDADEQGIPGIPIIIVLSDGLPSIGEVSPHEIRQNIKTYNLDARASINTIAFGSDANQTFLEQIARENHGHATYIDPQESASEEIVRFYRRFAVPLLTNVEFSISPGWTIAPTWRDLNIYNGSEALLFGMAPAETSLSITVKALARNGTIEYEAEIINKLTEDIFRTFLPSLWAFERIQDLLLQITIQGETEQLTNAILQLALEYGLVTPYTGIVLVFPSGNDEILGNERDQTTLVEAGGMGMSTGFDSFNSPLFYAGILTTAVGSWFVSRKHRKRHR